MAVRRYPKKYRRLQKDMTWSKDPPKHVPSGNLLSKQVNTCSEITIKALN